MTEQDLPWHTVTACGGDRSNQSGKERRQPNCVSLRMMTALEHLDRLLASPAVTLQRIGRDIYARRRAKLFDVVPEVLCCPRSASRSPT